MATYSRNTGISNQSLESWTSSVLCSWRQNDGWCHVYHLTDGCSNIFLALIWFVSKFLETSPPHGVQQWEREGSCQPKLSNYQSKRKESLHVKIGCRVNNWDFPGNCRTGNHIGLMRQIDWYCREPVEINCFFWLYFSWCREFTRVIWGMRSFRW